MWLMGCVVGGSVMCGNVVDGVCGGWDGMDGIG